MGFNEDVQKNIVREIEIEYKEASFWLPFSALELKKVFEPEELEAMQEFLHEMNSSSDSNERAAKLKDKVTDYSKVIIKLLKLAKVV